MGGVELQMELKQVSFILESPMEVWKLPVSNPKPV